VHGKVGHFLQKDIKLLPFKNRKIAISNGFTVAALGLSSMSAFSPNTLGPYFFDHHNSVFLLRIYYARNEVVSKKMAWWLTDTKD
jgi:hypothetical protein